jgi:transposase
MSKQYDLDFKLNAVKLIKEQKLTVLQVSKDLGVAKSTLHKWATTLDHHLPQQAFPGKGHLRAEDERFKKLERENEILRRERDILKKALAIFSSP